MIIPEGVHTINELRVDDKGELIKIGRWNILDKVDRRIFHKKEQDSQVVAKIQFLLEKEGVEGLKNPHIDKKVATKALTKKEVNGLLKGNYGPVITAIFTKSITPDKLKTLINDLHLEKPLSKETFGLLFEAAHEIEEYVKDPSAPNRDTYKALYNEKIKPRLNEAKELLEKRPIHFAAKAAASKGKALIAALTAKQALHENMNANVESRNKVVLLPEHGAVFKQMGERSKEETLLVDGLFDLLSKQATIGTFDVTKENYEAKPFVEMTLASNLSTAAFHKISERLTGDDEYNAILTGELQLLDLHSGNLGIRAQITDPERFSDFQIEHGQSKTLQQFLISYVSGQIADGATITYKEHGTAKTVQCKDLPKELKNARFQLVIFDTDLSLGEDNRLQVQIRDEERQHLIPLRSYFLEGPLKDKPLSADTINRLLESGERHSQATKWLRREDAPILQKLSQETREKVKAWIAPKLEKYSLTNARESDSSATLKSVREAFAQELAAEDSPLWQEFAGKERKKIAMQLFPRATARQQQALLDRQKSMKSYLSSYQELALYSGPKLIQKIEEFLTKPETPLTTIEKQKLLSMLEQLTTEKQVEEMRQILLENCIPTYFNIMKAMYPLLADVFQLTKIAYGDALAGQIIGHFDYPLEKIIAEIRSNHVHNKDAMELANLIEQKINSIKDPSFFGEWG